MTPIAKPCFRNHRKGFLDRQVQHLPHNLSAAVWYRTAFWVSTDEIVRMVLALSTDRSDALRFIATSDAAGDWPY